MISRFLFATLTLSAFALAAPRAGAQALDGAWFKVTVNARGVGVEAGTNSVSKAKGKLVAYMNVTSALIGPEGATVEHIYDFDLWTEVTPGNWSLTQSSQFRSTGENERVLSATAPTTGIEIVLPIGDDEGLPALTVQFVANAKIKLDGEGALKRASFKSTGTVIPGSNLGDEFVYGGGKVSGRTVPPEKLPFSLEA